MVAIHTVSLAYIQRRTNEAGPTESELHRRCKEDAEWSDAIRQQIVLDNRVDWLIAASINFSSTTALRFADLEGLPPTTQ